MKKLLMLKGLPASGKSTYAKELVKEQGFVRANKDDLRAMLQQDTVLEPGQTLLIPTGLAIHIGDPGVCGLVFPRSGLGHRHGVVLGNGTGVIDADYQGPLQISLWNRGSEAYTIQPGDRVAQLVLVPIVRMQPMVVEHFDASARGTGGFGHTGLR